MRLSLNKLRFTLPDNPFGNNTYLMLELADGLKQITKRAGTDSDSFKAAWAKVYNAVVAGRSLENIIENKLDIRALGFVLNSKVGHKIQLTSLVLDRIDSITDCPSSLFLESFFQYYLSRFRKLSNVEHTSKWLVEARRKRQQTEWFDEELISQNGPKWVAQQAISKNKDFDFIAEDLKLDQFQSGQFMEQAKRIYYVEQLKKIPINKPHELLIEVQKQDVYESNFDSSELLGHKILKILIERAPSHDIHESWLNTIMSIAGDPRIPVSHPRYIKWWSHVSKDMATKVKGWLSGLDLRLFLEALEDFSYSSSDPDMARMFPSRKKFLEGLHHNKLIKNTKLYMSRSMARFLREKYREEHLPDFSIVDDGEKSIIYVDLDTAHIIEGSHQCQLWIYRSLHESAPVLKYDRQRQSYRDLTVGLNRKMLSLGYGAYEHFNHSPQNFSWQRKAVESLKQLRVPITMKDVLTADDYRIYVRRFGA